MSTQAEADVTLTLTAPEEYGTKLHLVLGETEWAGSLTAHQPQAFQFSVCVREAGAWPIRINALLRLPDGNRWRALETIHLESSSGAGQLLRGQDFMVIVGKVKPTPNPVTVSPECSGQSE